VERIFNAVETVVTVGEIALTNRKIHRKKDSFGGSCLFLRGGVYEKVSYN
jgi:hypothetical protein